jgi:hypothetical protein
MSQGMTRHIGERDPSRKDRNAESIERDCDEIARLVPKLIAHYAERYEDCYRRPSYGDGGRGGSGSISDPTSGALGASTRIRDLLTRASVCVVSGRRDLEDAFDWASAPGQPQAPIDPPNFRAFALRLDRLAALGRLVTSATATPEWRKLAAQKAKRALDWLHGAESALNRADEVLDEAHPATISRPDHVARTEIPMGA